MSNHPVKSFHLPASFLSRLLSLPAQVVFAITGLLGIAHYSRHIVLIKPHKPSSVNLRKSLSHGKQNGLSLSEWIETNVPSLHGSFTPSWWLPNGHLQTIFSAFAGFDTIDKVQYVRTLLRVPDGGTIALDFTPPNHDTLPANAPTIVVSHGLTGGSHESYVRNILEWVVRPKSKGGLGGRGVVVNFRGCAGTPLTSPCFYSAGTTMDLGLSLHYLRHLYPSSPLHGIGFSLGAAVLSRYLGEAGSSALLSSGIALGCPWNMTEMSKHLETGFFIPLIYSRALGDNLRKLYVALHKKHPGVLDNPDRPEAADFHQNLDKIIKMGNGVRLKKIDNVMVSQVGGPWGVGLWPFENADEYYAWASPSRLIHGVKRPLLAINAFDDPIVCGDALPIEEFQKSSHIFTAVTGSGGHLGWFSGPLFARSSRRKSRWVKQPVSEFFEAAVRDLASVDQVVEVVDELGEAEEKWNWVEKPAHDIVGFKRVGWRVLSSGQEIDGAGESGVLQGL